VEIIRFKTENQPYNKTLKEPITIGEVLNRLYYQFFERGKTYKFESKSHKEPVNDVEQTVKSLKDYIVYWTNGFEFDLTKLKYTEIRFCKNHIVLKYQSDNVYQQRITKIK
jgi:hypothetical protein